MKYFNLIVVIGMLGMFSCQNSDDFTGNSTVSFTAPASSIDISDMTVVEGDAVIPFTISIDNAVDVDLHYNITVEGTATEGEDFDLSTHSTIIPAYSTSTSGEIYIYADTATEGTESFTISVGDEATANTTGAPLSRVVTIMDLGAMSITFDWSGTYDDMGTVVSFCDSVDIDVFVLDPSGADLGIYDAATAACPEGINIQGWANGTYTIAFNMWSNLLDELDAVPLPVSVNLFKDATFNETVIWDGYDTNADQGGAAPLIPAMDIEVLDGVFTIKDTAGGVIVSGFQNPKASGTSK